MSLYTGGTCLVVFSAYVLVHTVPHWGDWVTASIARQHGVTAVIGGQYAALTAASYAHAVAHYDLVATVGAGTLVGPASGLMGGQSAGRRQWHRRWGRERMEVVRGDIRGGAGPCRAWEADRCCDATHFVAICACCLCLPIPICD